MRSSEAIRLPEREQALISGWLVKKGTTNNKRIWVVLRPEKLTFYKNEQEYKSKEVISNEDISAIAHYKHKHPKSFYLYINDKIVRLGAESVDLAEAWVRQLRMTTGYHAPVCDYPASLCLINLSGHEHDNVHTNPSISENSAATEPAQSGPMSLYDLIKVSKQSMPPESSHARLQDIDAARMACMSGHNRSASIQNLMKLLNENKVLMQGPVHWLHGSIHHWSKSWAVVRGSGLFLYTSEDEYKPLKVISIKEIQDVAEINISPKAHKVFFTVITKLKPIEFRVHDEQSLVMWVGALKAAIDKSTGNLSPVASRIQLSSR
ncbi:fungal protein [Schizosaccharomyces japonicus yFS275]|uniref:Fungal protein n=1 Tax=Schizosaccharomyces japonicus (strain yFS275 / FY16936) TaxID=402676 RepID=B6K0U2_SCHJY|nr:fungal protein [Schizosaccharomyces japonicus yFS275]EEB07563.1 fungal protein [Schizosaccharomyces japonicus yFS275]